MKEVKEYHSNEKLFRHYWRNESYQINSVFKSWRDNGQLAVHCFFKNGLRQGEYKRWWSDGQLWAHYFCHNDKEIDITEYVSDINDITEHEYFQLQLMFGYFPIFKYDA